MEVFPCPRKQHFNDYSKGTRVITSCRYMFPSLRERMSDGLSARMQGKSCFNFKVMDETLLKELII